MSSVSWPSDLSSLVCEIDTILGKSDLDERVRNVYQDMHRFLVSLGRQTDKALSDRFVALAESISAVENPSIFQKNYERIGMILHQYLGACSDKMPDLDPANPAAIRENIERLVSTIESSSPPRNYVEVNLEALEKEIERINPSQRATIAELTEKLNAAKEVARRSFEPKAYVVRRVYTREETLTMMRLEREKKAAALFRLYQIQAEHKAKVAALLEKISGKRV